MRSIEDLKQSLLIWGVLSKEGIEFIKSKKERVIVPEMRPSLLGLKINIPLLKRNNIPFIYCTDNTLGFLFYKNKIKHTLLFFKEELSEGLRCITGSLYVVLLSHLHNIDISFFKMGYLQSNSLTDKDASTIDGRKVVLNEDIPFVEEVKDEVIEWKVLK